MQPTSWNEAPIKEYTYTGRNSGNTIVEFMNWRMIFPVGYKWDGSVKYPLIVMLHGSGESGRLGCCGTNWTPSDVRYDNNDHNVTHGGKEHQAGCGYSVATGNPSGVVKWPGIVIWPQSSYQAGWEGGWNGGTLAEDGQMVVQIIEWLIKATKVRGGVTVSRFNIDPDRISMHGLSNGAQGLWDVAAKRPDLFAAILPMSGVPTNYDLETTPLVTTKIWQFQGGVDVNPNPQASMDVRDMLIAKGGTPRYTLYPALGHVTWPTAYLEPDFWNFMLTADKKKIYVFGGDPSICTGGSVQLGISPNYIAYQWTKDGVDIVGATTSRYFANAAGDYTVKFRRRTDAGVIWISAIPVHVTQTGASTFSPTVTTTGSIVLPISDGGTPLGGVNNIIKITAPVGFSQYNWTRNGSPLTVFTGNYYSFSAQTGVQADAGIYRVSVLQANGCTSLNSDAVNVTWNNPQPTTPGFSGIPVPTKVDPTTMNVTWNDVTGETAYEVWRSRRFALPPQYPQQLLGLVTILPANTTSFLDQMGLRAGAEYLYRIRAIMGTSGGVFSGDSPYIQLDTEPAPSPPTAPTNLVASNITETSATLTWDPALDNVLVYKYEVYNGPTLVATLTGDPDGNPLPLTTITLTGLVTSTSYVFNVRAADYIGNFSPFSDGISVATSGPTQGLSFKYYTFNGLLLEPAGHQLDEDPAYNPPPPFTPFDFDQTPSQTGVVANFDISGAAGFQGNPDPGSFVYAFDGFIDVIAGQTGTYRFQLTSDEGSRLYINGNPVAVVNNDGVHTSTAAIGSVSIPTIGRIPIRVTYFEDFGAQGLTVMWDTPGGSSSFVAIPNTRLFVTDAKITNFYIRSGQTNLTNFSTWTTSTTGGSGGINPTTFGADYQYFNIARSGQASYNLSLAAGQNWSVTGKGSKVIVGGSTTTTTLTVTPTATFSGKMDMAANSTIHLNSPSLPNFGILDPTSTVNFNGGVNLTLPNTSYGNANFLSANQYTFPVSTTVVKGNLTFSNGATTLGTAINQSTLRVAGNITFSNATGNPLPPTPAQQYSLVFTGNKTHTVSFANPVDPQFFSLRTDFNDNVSFTNSGVHTYTFGSQFGGGLNLESGSNLNIGDNNLVVTGSGAINPSGETGTLSVNGGNVTITTTGFQNSNVYFDDNQVINFTASSASNSHINIMSLMDVRELVTVTGGDVNSSGGSVTLLSDASGTARVAPITGGGKISGSITAQRYMEDGLGRIYRYISSPVKGLAASAIQQFIPITGTFAGHSTGLGLGPAASMFSYTEPNYLNFPASNGSNQDTLSRGKGYAIFVRESEAATTWEALGTPYQGTIPFALTAGTGAPNDGWNLLGNPYPAPIKWTGSSTGGWNMTNINPTVYVRHNDNGTFKWYIYHPGIITPTGDQEILTNGIIAAGQAFWVMADVTPSLSISESAKYTTDGGIFYRTSDQTKEAYTPDVLGIKMANSTYSDVTYIMHDDAATENYEKLQDAVKQSNSFFNLSTRSKDGISLAINVTPQTFCEKEVKLNIENAAVGSYSLNFFGLKEFKHPVRATLKDNFTGTTTNLEDGSNYMFAVTSDAASSGAGRFVITEKPVVVTDATLKTNAICESNPSVTLLTSQEGVQYQAIFNGGVVSDVVTAKDNGSIDLTIDRHALGFGTHTITLVAGFNGCEKSTLEQSIDITIDTLESPSITYQSGMLVATPANAEQYEWYLDGVVLTGKTDPKIPHDGGEGTYQVQVTSGTCSKVSNAYRVTGTDQDLNSLVKAYPNPFRDQMVVTLPEKIQGGTVTLINPIGQKVHSQTIAPQDSNNVTLNFAGVEAGAYVLSVGRYKFKVIKVN